MTELNFSQFLLTGINAKKFLQGQVTCNVAKLADTSDYQATAICNLKGRVAFGIWLKQLAPEQYAIVISQDCAENFAKHIKKFGAFSKMTLVNPEPIFAIVENGIPTFSQNAKENADDWQAVSIAQGNYWITHATQDLFQPQELRLHQRGGVDYDKGCYLGQEIIARLWFKASPKAWLHRVSGIGDLPNAGEKLEKIDVVNSIAMQNDEKGSFEALVVARPADLATVGLTVLDLPGALQQPVERAK